MQCRKVIFLLLRSYYGYLIHNTVKLPASSAAVMIHSVSTNSTSPSHFSSRICHLSTLQKNGKTMIEKYHHRFSLVFLCVCVYYYYCGMYMEHKFLPAWKRRSVRVCGRIIRCFLYFLHCQLYYLEVSAAAVVKNHMLPFLWLKRLSVSEITFSSGFVPFFS